MNTTQSIGFEKLSDCWSYSRKKSRSISWALRILLSYGLIVPLLFSAYRGWRSFTVGDYLTFGWIVLFSIPLIWACIVFWSRWMRIQKGHVNSESVVEVSRQLSEQVWNLVRPEAQRLKIDKERFRVFVKKDRFDVNIGVFETDGIVSLFISLGFTKLLSADAKSAKSMILHEFGHVLNKDSKLWTLVNIFYSVHLKILLPAYLVVMAISISMGAFSLYRIHTTRQTLESDYKKDNEIIEIRKEKENAASSDFSAWTDGHQVGQEYERMKSELGRAKQNIFMGLAPFAIAPILIGFLYLSIKSARRLSERLADMAVFLLNSGTALRDAIATYGTEIKKSNLKGFLVMFHPPLPERLKQLDQFQEILNASSENAPALRQLRRTERLTQFFRWIKFSAFIGAIFAIFPTIMLLTDEGYDDLFERIAVCFCIFLGVFLISLVSYVVIQTLTNLVNRGKSRDPFPG